MTQGLQTTPARNHLPATDATLWRTNTPGFMLILPCTARISVEAGLSAACEGYDNAVNAASVFFEWQAAELKEVLISIVPDVGDEIEPQWMRDEHWSKLEIHHVDPYGVVPYLVTEFRTVESYWFRAVAKALEAQGVKVVVEETAARSNRRRPGRP